MEKMRFHSPPHYFCRASDMHMHNIGMSDMFVRPSVCHTLV